MALSESVEQSLKEAESILEMLLHIQQGRRNLL
jgi:hypothetical protein